MQPWDLNKTGATTLDLTAGADPSSNDSTSNHSSGMKKKRTRDYKMSPATVSGGSCDDNSGIKKKRTRFSKVIPATVVITDISNFRAKVHKLTGMPTPPSSSTSEESKSMPPLLFKPRAQRAEISVPLTNFPSLSSYCCNLSLTDHLLRLPLEESETPTNNSMLQLPPFRYNKSSNHNSSNSFEELLEELELTKNGAI